MSNDESRNQFEDWFKSKKSEMMKKGLSMLSISKVHSFQLSAWQASRQAIEIPPPDPVTTREALDAGYMGDYAAGRDGGIDDTLKLVREAGIKIKGE